MGKEIRTVVVWIDNARQSGIPVPDATVAEAPLYRPDPSSPELKYMLARRQALGGFVPKRVVQAPAIHPALGDSLDEFLHQFPSVSREQAQAALVYAREALEAVVAA